jgi:hypothetical protein
MESVMAAREKKNAWVHWRWDNWLDRNSHRGLRVMPGARLGEVQVGVVLQDPEVKVGVNVIFVRLDEKEASDLLDDLLRALHGEPPTTPLLKGFIDQ